MYPLTEIARAKMKSEKLAATPTYEQAKMSLDIVRVCPITSDAAQQEMTEKNVPTRQRAPPEAKVIRLSSYNLRRRALIP